MSTFPKSLLLLECGIVLINVETSAVQRIVALQYNPNSLTPQALGRGDRGGGLGSVRSAAADRAAQGNNHAEYHFLSESNDPEVQGRAEAQGRRA